MDEDLVRRLRNASVFYNRLSELLPNGSVTGELIDEAAELIDEAADAIEALSKELMDLKMLTCCCCEPPKEDEE